MEKLALKQLRGSRKNRMVSVTEENKNGLKDKKMTTRSRTRKNSGLNDFPPTSKTSFKSGDRRKKQRKHTLLNDVNGFKCNLCKIECETHVGIGSSSPISSKESSRIKKQRKVAVSNSANICATEVEIDPQITILNSAASSKESPKNKKKQHNGNIIDHLEPNMCTIESEADSPISVVNSPNSSKGSQKGRKRRKATIVNSISSLESDLCVMDTEAITIPSSPTSSKESPKGKKLHKATVSNSSEQNLCATEFHTQPSSILTLNSPASSKSSTKSKKEGISGKKNIKKLQKALAGDEVKISNSDNTLGSCAHFLETDAIAVKNVKPKNRERKQNVPNSSVKNLTKHNEFDVNKICNLNPTVKIVQLPLIDFQKGYKESEITMPLTKAKETLAFHSNINKTTQHSKPTIRKKKFQGLLSDMVIKNLRKKIIKRRTPTSTPNSSIYNLNASTNHSPQLSSPSSSVKSKSSQHSHIDDVHFSSQLNHDLDNCETISKILRHKHGSIQPFNIKINIDNRKQERIVEFAKPVELPLTLENKKINTPLEYNISYSASVTHVPSSLVHYDWSYNIHEEDLLKITSHNKLFAHSLLTPTAEYENSVIGQNQKIQDDAMSSHSSYESSAKSDFEFVKPCKRPPTRHKTSKSSNCDDSFHSMSDVSTFSNASCPDLPTVEDDVISIYSEWSIKTKDFTTTTLPSSKGTATSQAQITSTLNEIVKKPENIMTIKPNLPLSETSYKNTAQWVEHTQMYQNQHTNLREQIPLPFQQLCYFVFTQGRCPRKVCKFAHNFKRDPHFGILPLLQLRDAYQYTKDKPILFMAYITHFIKAFSRHNCSVDLVSIVKDVVVPENTKQIWNVKEIICALEQTGHSFESAIEKIMTFYKNDNFNVLNILLTIVFENENNLCANWHLVQKLCQYRNYALVDPVLVNRAMTFCYKTYNIELSIKLVNDIFKRELVNIESIAENHLGMFVLLLERNDLKEADIVSCIARLKSNNCSTNDGFVHTTSNSCNYIAPINVGDLNKLGAQATYDTNSNGNFNSNRPFQPVIETNKYWAPNNFPTATNTVYERLNNATTIYNHQSSNIEPEVIQACGNEEIIDEQLDYEPNELLYDKEYNKVETKLPDSEIKRLDRVISHNDHETLISMYNQYKNASNSNSFVLNVVGLFKKNTPTFTLDLVQRLIDGLENQNIQLQTADATLYSLILNTVGILKQLKGFTEAAKLLNIFIDCLENLTRVQWFRSVHIHPFTIVGKYLYFCQIFTRGKFYKSTLKILKSPELKLLHSSNKWALPHTKTFDEEFRNKVLDEFILATLQNDLDVAKDIILNIMMMAQEDTITEIETSRYFDKLVLSMLNANQVKQLTEMLPNIINKWYKHLKPANMRALLITFVAKRIPEPDLIMLYSKCCQQDIYPSLKGNETRIVLTTDLTAEEIFITIRYFFYKMLKHNYEIQEILITIRMADQLYNKPAILIHSQWGITQTKERTLIVLTKCFPSIIIVQNCGDDIKLKADQLKMCMESYRKSHSRCFWVRQSSVERMVPM